MPKSGLEMHNQEKCYKKLRRLRSYDLKKIAYASQNNKLYLC